MLAAITLVFAGGPGLAAAMPCDPCPDCPMMQQMAASADHHGQPGKAPKADDGCRFGVICHASIAAAPAAPMSDGVLLWANVGEAQRPARELPASSRPPDRSLRPPIQL